MSVRIYNQKEHDIYERIMADSLTHTGSTRHGFVYVKKTDSTALNFPPYLSILPLNKNG